jgi:hypothetical protein
VRLFTAKTIVGAITEDNLGNFLDHCIFIGAHISTMPEMLD